MKKTIPLEVNYPSIAVAYDIAIKSYDWCLNRSNAIDDTIDKLLAWISSLTIAIPTFVYGQHIKTGFNSTWFKVALTFAAASIIAGVTTKIVGSLKLISPQRLYDKHLHKPELVFKMNMIYRAGSAFNHNQSLVNHKGYFSILMIICFVCEIAALWLWITAA